MKIALYGNVCNNLFTLGLALKNSTSYDVTLYLDENPPDSNLPESDYAEYKNNYPSWIKRGKAYSLNSVFFFWKKNIYKELKKADVIISSSLPVALFSLLKKPKKVFYVSGADMNVLPFYKIAKKYYIDNLKMKGFQKYVLQLKFFLLSVIQRAGIKNTDIIISQKFNPFLISQSLLNIPTEKISDNYLPIIFNPNLFKYIPNAINNILGENKNLLKGGDFHIFHPSRFVFTNDEELNYRGLTKNNKLLFYAFHKFITQYNIENAKLVLIKRVNQDSNYIEILELIKELGISNKIVWLEPENSLGFSRHSLINYYSVMDVVADDFGPGWFGSICIEGFCCEKPVLSYVDEIAMKKMYPWHPFLSSNTVEGNSDMLYKLYSDKNFKEEAGKKGRYWAVEFHSAEKVTKKYVEVINSILK